MKNLKLYLLIFTGTLLSLVGCATKDINLGSIVLSEEHKQVYESGQPLVLYAYGDETQSSEAYADWAAYLNGFEQSEGQKYFFDRVKNVDFPVIGTNVDEFTLFIKKGYPVYYYQGFVVEPQVYTAIDNKFSAKELTAVDLAFIPKELVLSQ